jgi:nucleoside-diphosphate-sugar epimerase
MRILVTGATGKVGRTFIDALFADHQRSDATVVALCHNRVLPENDRLSVVKGSISDRAVVEKALEGVTHVVHLATCKEIPEDVMDVTVKGLFWLLETARQSPTFERFVLIGGDAGMGHFVYPHPTPVSEAQPWSPYPGCYALSKVLEECMLEQYYTQYDFDGCCLRAPWIMEKDDFRFSLSFGDDVFGGPRWRDLVGPEQADAYLATGTVPILQDADGTAIQRNFVHVDDLVAAMLIALDHPKARQQLFNICMDEPVDYQVVADHLAATRDLPSVGVRTEYHSTWLDNTKAKFLLGWRPTVDTTTLVDRAWDYERAADDQRKIWYPG